MKIGKYSFGIGDRFGHQGLAQLRAIQKAKIAGIDIIPVWNKSHREHGIVGTTATDVRNEADHAVRELGWQGEYYVDADHINMSNVNGYIDYSDFFTIDVADYILEPADIDSKTSFIQQNIKYTGELRIPGISKSFKITEELLSGIADKYLYATQKASEIYQYIIRKGGDNIVPEVSMDEVNDPQSPVELFFILSALASENLPLQTIAPKFTGRFNKGVDYEGDVQQFEKEFEEDLMVIEYAIQEFGLPENLKLSVHSGSDKFSIYPIIGKLIKKHDKGIHVKTAGTTWLEEIIGLAEAGGEGLKISKAVYRNAYEKQNALCAPYAAVIDIDPDHLPSPDSVDKWDNLKFANTLRHIPGHAEYNPHFRQLIHVGYKVAAEMGEEYIDALSKFAGIVARNVEENIFDRHIKRLFEI
jgi:tagaturonate epimerase